MIFREFFFFFTPSITMAYGKRRMYKKRPVRRVRKRRVSRKAPARRATIKKVVKQVLARQVEKKTFVASWTDVPGVLQSTSSTIVGNYRVLSPSQSSYGWTLLKGTDDNNRVGNNVMIKRLCHKFVIDVRPYNASTNTQVQPLYVRLYYFRSKWNPVADVALGNLCGANANFFDNGNGDTGFGGTMMDMNRRIQSENYTYLCHRTYKLAPSLPATGSTTGTAHFYSNNDFKFCAVGSVELGRHCKSKVLYNDANQVQTPWIFFIAQVVAADNSLLSPTTLPVNIVSQIMCDYTDA